MKKKIVNSLFVAAFIAVVGLNAGISFDSFSTDQPYSIDALIKNAYADSEDEKETAMTCPDGMTVKIYCEQGSIDCSPKDCY